MCGLYNAKQMWKIRHNFLMSLTAQPNESWCTLRCIRMMACINQVTGSSSLFLSPGRTCPSSPHLAKCKRPVFTSSGRKMRILSLIGQTQKYFFESSEKSLLSNPHLLPSLPFPLFPWPFRPVCLAYISRTSPFGSNGINFLWGFHFHSHTIAKLDFATPRNQRNFPPALYVQPYSE